MSKLDIIGLIALLVAASFLFDMLWLGLLALVLVVTLVFLGGQSK